VLAALVLRLPDDTPRNPARGPIVAYPSIGGEGASVAAGAESGSKRLRWRDPRIMPWTLIGTIGGHGHAVLLGVVGFLVIDRLHLPLDHAQQWIALVMMAGAGASLLAQWWLIPQLGLAPRQLILWGSLLAAAGSAMTGLAEDVYPLTLGFALASLGFGLFRPGFTSGASLSVSLDEQNSAAGMVTSVNGAAFILAPTAGVALYMVAMPLPFLAAGALMLAVAAWTQWGFNPSDPAA
jgi:MFS family permease